MVGKIAALGENVHFIGAFDPMIRTFDIIMKTANGSSYNSYLVRGSEGVCVMDTVKKEFSDHFFKRLELLCEYEEIRYIVLHHLEPDHSGALDELMQRAPQAKLIISGRAVMMLKALLKKDIEFEIANTGKTISLGDKTIEFLSTPFLHWPDTMSSYLHEDQILFSGDVFGSHYYDERLFDDEVGDFSYAFKYYYQHIMRPFKQYVRQALDLYQQFDISLIAPLHGPVLRTNPQNYINKYELWSQDAKAHKNIEGKKILSVFYMSSYDNTLAMAEKITQGADAVAGMIASMYDLASLEEQNMIDLLEESDAVIVGSPTINGDAVKPAWDLLACMPYLESAGKVGATFGSYGWTGEAPDMLHDRMQWLKFRLPVSPLKIKLIPTDEELKLCEAFGREVAEIAMGKMVELEL
ncbi:FprA family A-type flavoprotein [Sulfurovum sp. zt1-1]|uniref:FprA family A-type flavoprotein n=1 Tax=Sulfurovum zhangzhouensis TaxID=3019067 RepID=A0ABT7QVE6_9BACT|nr:FprA family A-type flavoprotein [Sulfurovum zhangzhouensis]MDM5270814.1 FprA family A-type flavoprotein [Sulfurovum zhangzhouensis]